MEQVGGYQCSAQYPSGPGAAPRDVTGFATWSTSDSSIATVDSTGWVTVYRDGNVAVRASYRDGDGFLSMQMQAGGLQRYYYALSGYVRDAQSSAVIANATVQIVAGPNAGQSTTTGSDGTYQFYNLQAGTFTLKFSKAGYVTTERTFTLTGTQLNGLDVTLATS